MKTITLRQESTWKALHLKVFVLPNHLVQAYMLGRWYSRKHDLEKTKGTLVCWSQSALAHTGSKPAHTSQQVSTEHSSSQSLVQWRLDGSWKWALGEYLCHWNQQPSHIWVFCFTTPVFNRGMFYTNILKDWTENIEYYGKTLQRLETFIFVSCSPREAADKLFLAQPNSRPEKGHRLKCHLAL